MEAWRRAEASPPFDAFIDALLDAATRSLLEVTWTAAGALRIRDVMCATRHVEIASAARALRTLCARVAIRIGEASGGEPPLYGGRGALRAPDGTMVDVELSNQQRSGYWIRLRRAGPTVA